jgi:hypothetical protein
MKDVLYASAVLCFVGAGFLDLHAGETKLAVVAWMFAVVNATVFFWR